uniref:Uncharacterized protein n=1 Tax=Pithovirus LCPAC401 TaxID=2506595 RepID=A0A481ZAB0_9VIRU|nr:MAG: hypothetical protein LCPAC401_00430 [Pithovirus LCPAC401]
MHVYTVICENSRSETSIDVYHNYDDAFKEAERLMLLEIDRVYEKASLDELGVKLKKYPKLLYDNGSIIIQCMYIEIIKKEVQ